MSKGSAFHKTNEKGEEPRRQINHFNKIQRVSHCTYFLYCFFLLYKSFQLATKYLSQYKLTQMFSNFVNDVNKSIFRSYVCLHNMSRTINYNLKNTIINFTLKYSKISTFLYFYFHGHCLKLPYHICVHRVHFDWEETWRKP